MNSKNVISLLLVIFGLCQSAKSAFTTQQKKRNNCPTDVGDFIDILRTKRHKCEVLVGYHGSCSPFKSSLEERIEINSENEFPGQLGRRFYTSDTAKSAFSKSGLKYISNTAARIPTIQKPWELGQAACTRYQSSQRTTGLSTEDIQPIVCSIYADVSALPRLPKTYIPSYLPVPSDSQEVQPRDKTLYYDEKAMLEYERIVRAKRDSDNEFSHLNPIRITKLNVINLPDVVGTANNVQTSVISSDTQAGWSNDGVVASNLKAYCVVVNPDSRDELKRLESGKMRKILLFNEYGV